MRKILTLILASTLLAFYAYSEEHRFHYEIVEDGEFPDSIESIAFQPNTGDPELFMLFLESSTDLTNWRQEGLQNYAIDDDGFIIVEGSETSNRKFWRLRIIPPNVDLDDHTTWAASLVVNRDENILRARLDVRTEYWPFVQLYTRDALEHLPIPWEDSSEALDAATEAAIQRIFDIINKAQPRKGDKIQVTRDIQ